MISGLLAKGREWFLKRLTQPVARRIDHIIIETSEAEKLYDILTEKFQFPIMWEYSSFDRYECGGIYVGNTTLEILKWKKTPHQPGTEPNTLAHPQGLAIEPIQLKDSLMQIQLRRIPFKTPYAHQGTNRDGIEEIIYTNVVLPTLFEKDDIAFFCDYSQSVKAYKRKAIQDFGPIEDRPLGVIGLTEVCFTQKNSTAICSVWDLFMRPETAIEPGSWKIENVDVRITSESGASGRYIKFKVKSVEQTAKVLEGLGFGVVQDQDGSTMIDPKGLCGLVVRIYEK